MKGAKNLNLSHLNSEKRNHSNDENVQVGHHQMAQFLVATLKYIKCVNKSVCSVALESALGG